MGQIHLYNEDAFGHTMVSDRFIGQLMPVANGEFVKIYLYLLYCLQHCPDQFSVSAAADRMDCTDKDVMRALRYWERQHAMALDMGSDGSLAGIHLLPLLSEEEPTVGAALPAASGPAAALPVSDPGAVSSASPVAVPVQAADPSYRNPVSTASQTVSLESRLPASAAALAAACSSPAPSPARPHSYTAEEIQEFSQNPDIQELIFIIQTYLKHPLNDTDVNTILFWYQDLKFSPDLIDYLVEYSVSKGHSSLRYMNKIALSWEQEGIRDVASARENTASHSQTYYAVMKALGIHGRNLVPSENEFLRKWTADYGFRTDLICEACRRTMAATHQPSFEYTDSILSSWSRNQVSTMEDVSRLDEAHRQKTAANTAAAANGSTGQPRKNAFTDFTQRTYREEDLERMLLTSSTE